VVGDFRASLYDLFGYLLPGLVMTAGLGVIWWTAFGDSPVMSIDFFATGIGSVSCLLLAYLVGHVAHAVGNSLSFLRTKPEDEVLVGGHQWSLPSSVLAAIDRSLTVRFSVDVKDLTPRMKYSLMDEGRALLQREGDREVYVYREGFYRGMVVALAVVGVAAVVRGLTPRSCFSYGTAITCVTRAQAVILLLIIVAFAVAYYQRMVRFSRYRIERAALLWLNVFSSQSAATK